MDIVVVQLNSLVLKQAESLSVRERSVLADLLFYCYVYRIGMLDNSINMNGDLLQEFYRFLENCQAFDHQRAVKNLLNLGMIEEMFQVWHATNLQVGSFMQVLTQGEYMDLSSSLVDRLLPILKDSEQMIGSQQVVFNSPLFRSFSADRQVEMILQDDKFIRNNVRTLVNSVPLISRGKLEEMVSIFDPFGQRFRSIGFDTSETTGKQSSTARLSYDQVSVNDSRYIATSQDATELFLIVLLCLCFRLRRKGDEEASETKPVAPVDPPTLQTPSRMETLNKSSWLQENVEARSVVKVSCGCNHLAVITDSGELYTWGSNQSGQLGIGNKSVGEIETPVLITALDGKKITDIACGGEYTLASTSKISFINIVAH